MTVEPELEKRSPDSRWVVTVNYEDKTARIWDAKKTEEKPIILRGHENRVRRAAFSADSSKLLTVSDDRTARIWDPVSGRQLKMLRGHTGGLTAGSFSPDGNKVITASGDGTARIWDANTEQELLVLPGHRLPTSAGITSATINLDGTRALTYDKSLRLWDLENGQLLGRILCGTSLAREGAMFSPDGDAVAAPCNDGTLRIWSSRNARERTVFRVGDCRESGRYEFGIHFAAFDRTWSRMVTDSCDGTIRFWSVKSEREKNSVSIGSSSTRLGIAFGANGDFLIDADRGSVRRWNLSSGAVESPFPFKARGSNLAVARGSKPLKKLYTLERDRSVWLVYETTDGDTKVLRRDLDDWRPHFHKAAFSPDGARLVTVVNRESTVQVWDTETGKLLGELPGHQRPIEYVAISPDGKKIVTASEDKTIGIWDAANTQQLFEFKHPADRTYITILAVSSDGGKLLLTVGNEPAMRLVSSRTGEAIRVLRGHQGSPDSAAFSPDGSRIVSGGRTVRLWDTETGEEMAVLRGGHFYKWLSENERIEAVTFSPDGSRIASASDHRLVIWPVFETAEDVVAEARRRLPRRLTDEQRRRFFLQPAAVQ